MNAKKTGNESVSDFKDTSCRRGPQEADSKRWLSPVCFSFSVMRKEFVNVYTCQFCFRMFEFSSCKLFIYELKELRAYLNGQFICFSGSAECEILKSDFDIAKYAKNDYNNYYQKTLPGKHVFWHYTDKMYAGKECIYFVL